MTLDMYLVALSFGMAITGLVASLTYCCSFAFRNANGNTETRWIRRPLVALSSEKTSTLLLLSGYLMLLGSIAFCAAAV